VTTVTEAIEVDVPLRTAYNQWTQFEEFPQFMEDVKSVTQIDDTTLRWVAEIGGEQQEWRAEIVDQEPDSRIAWEAVGGNGPNGVVSFEPVDEGTTGIIVTFEWEPEGAKESIGAFLGLDSRRVKKELKRFKELIETRGFESGAWRGEVHQGTTTRR
jgi:uncharacterized membrane protein